MAKIDTLNSLISNWNTNILPTLEVTDVSLFAFGDWQGFGRYLVDNGVFLTPAMELEVRAYGDVTYRSKFSAIGEIARECYRLGQWATVGEYLLSNGADI